MYESLGSASRRSGKGRLWKKSFVGFNGLYYGAGSLATSSLGRPLRGLKRLLRSPRGRFVASLGERRRGDTWETATRPISDPSVAKTAAANRPSRSMAWGEESSGPERSVLSQFNPFAPKSDQHRFSPNSYGTSWREKCMRIKKIIKRDNSLIFFSNSLNIL